MLTKIKPFYAVLVHEDKPDDNGTPTEVIEYTWTRKGAEKVQKAAYSKMIQPYNKWVMVLPANWKWWWTINCGTVYRYVGFDDRTGTFLSTRVGWWRRERLWRALWRLARGRHKGSHRQKAKQQDQSPEEN